MYKIKRTFLRGNVREIEIADKKEAYRLYDDLINDGAGVAIELYEEDTLLNRNTII